MAEIFVNSKYRKTVAIIEHCREEAKLHAGLSKDPEDYHAKQAMVWEAMALQMEAELKRIPKMVGIPAPGGDFARIEANIYAAA